MKTRTTLLMALLAGGSFAYLWFVDRHREGTRDAAESASKLVSIDRDTIDSLSLRNGPTQIELRKADGIWRMEQPYQDEADTSAIDRLTSLLEGLRHDAKIELPKGKEQETLKEFGLTDSETSLKFRSAGGRETELLLGKDSAVSGKIYVRQQGQNSAFVIRNDLRDRIAAGADEFRDHRLSPTPASSVEKFTLKSGEDEIELERKSGAWDLVKPLRARAATSKVNDLLSGVLTARVSRFLPESASPEQGLSEPRATITAVIEGRKEPLVLQVGAVSDKEGDKDQSFARISGRNAVVVLANASLDPLLKARPNDLRDRKLVRVEPDIVDRITLEPKDRPPLVLMRKGEGWTCRDAEKETPVRDGLASKILSEILAAEIVDFVADLAAQPAKFGLDAPALRVRLSSFASENTAESKSGENPIVTLLFGKSEGEHCFLKLEEEPFIVSARTRLMESLPTELFDFLPLPTPEAFLNLKGTEVSTISIEGRDLATVHLQKGDGGWKQNEGDRTMDEAVVQNFLSKLEMLKAGRVAGSHARVAKALETPTLTLTLGSKNPDGRTQLVLKVGDALSDGLHPATLNGGDAVFLLTPADVSTLRAGILP